MRGKEEFGSVLKRARKGRGFTQDQLAERCGNMLTKSYISQFETGSKSRPSEEKCDALADALGESRNMFRELAGLPIINDKSRDTLADRFIYALERFKQLSPQMQEMAERHIKQSLDIFLEADSRLAR